jgi:hypothetical protein
MVVAPRSAKGPHNHFIRTGCFACIKGNVRIVVKVDGQYHEHYSGEAHDYLSVEIPTGMPALLQNLWDDEAFVLNMPDPADSDDERRAHGGLQRLPAIGRSAPRP